MTPKPIIVSIPHTGTRFLKERLGIEDHVHTINSWAKISDAIEGRPIIAPLRSPTEVWRSWCRRRGPKMWERDDFASVGLAFGQCYVVMHTLDMMYDVDFICVDKREDPRIEDWSAVGDQDHGPWENRKIDLRPLFKLPFVKRHYRA